MAGDRFVVEAQRQAVGIAIRVPGGFQFFASHPSVSELDGRVFPHAKTIVRRANEIAKFDDPRAKRWASRAASSKSAPSR